MLVCSFKLNLIFFYLIFLGGQFDQLFYQGQMTERAMWQKSWDVNVVGTQIFTSTFMPLLLKSPDPRLLFLASGTSSLAGTEIPNIPPNKVPEAGWPKQGFAVPAYRSAKTGLNMLMREYKRMLTEDGVKVWGISPGFLATGLGAGVETNKSLGAQDPETVGPFVKSVLDGQRDGDVGKVILGDRVQAW